MHDSEEPSYYRYVCMLNGEMNIYDTISMFERHKVEVAKPIFKPLHQYLNLPKEDFPNTEKAYLNSISLPIYPTLQKNEADWKNIVVKYFKEAFRRTADARVSDVTGKPLWIRLLAKTQLLNNSRQEGKIIGKYSDKIVLYGTQGHTWNAYENVVLDKHHYLPGLSELIEKKEVSDCSPVPGTSVFSEWDVSFSGGWKNSAIENF